MVQTDFRLEARNGLARKDKGMSAFLVVFLGGMILTLAFLDCGKKVEKEEEIVIIARVNDSVLTNKEYEEWVPPEFKNLYGPSEKRGFVERWIETELLYEEAKSKGLDKDKEIRRKLEEFKRMLLEDEVMQRDLDSLVVVSDLEARQYYETNKEQFARDSDEVRISQIATSKKADAENIRRQLLAEQDRFAEIAKSESIDDSNINGGDVGYYTLNELMEPLREPARTLRINAISPVLEVPPFGYYIIKVTDRKKAGTIPVFEDTKYQIEDLLLYEKEQEARKTHLAELKRKADIEVNWDLLEKLDEEK